MKKNIKKEKNKKKLYKNWKLYASALGALVIGTGTGLGIYYGTNTNHSEVTKTDLSTLKLEATILSKENMTKETALQAFLNANNIFTDLQDNIEIKSFIAPSYIWEGRLVISAKENSKKYTGNIKINISDTSSREQEERLQKIKKAYQDNNNSAYNTELGDYLSFAFQNIDLMNLVLTKEELKDTSTLENNLIKQFKKFTITELEKWNIPKDLIENSTIINKITKVTDETIEVRFIFHTTIKHLNDSNYIDLITSGANTIHYIITN